MSPSTQKSSALYNYNLMTAEIWTVWNMKLQTEGERARSVTEGELSVWHRSEVKIETREKKNSWRWGVLYTDLPPLPHHQSQTKFRTLGCSADGWLHCKLISVQTGSRRPSKFQTKVFLQKLGRTFNSISASNDGIFSFIFFFFPFSPQLLPLGISGADQPPATKMSPPSLGAPKLSLLKVQEE